MERTTYENPACDAAGTTTCIGTTVKRYPLSEGNAILCLRHFYCERLADIQQGIKPAEWSDTGEYSAE
jgi:hypothetical protein